MPAPEPALPHQARRVGRQSLEPPCGHAALNAPDANSNASCHFYEPSCAANTSEAIPETESLTVSSLRNIVGWHYIRVQPTSRPLYYQITGKPGALLA